MPYDQRTRVQRFLIALFFVLVLIYGGFRAYPLIAGPSLEIIYPQDGDTVASTTFQVLGVATRIKEITLQGKAITIDEGGRFNETLVSYYPYTILVITATDSYGATITKTIRVIPEPVQ